MDNDRQITLRIKSASHKYAEDVQFVVAKSSTVKQVKELIRANYPFHPEIKEQRLIYSGHILEDAQVFSDFLLPNTDGGGESYVVHLCCTNSFTRREREQINASKDGAPGAEGGHENEELLTHPWSAPPIQVPGGVPQEILSLHQAYLQQMLSFMTHWNAGYYAPLGAQLPGFNAAPMTGAPVPPQMYFQQMGPDMVNPNLQQPQAPAAGAAAAPQPQQPRPAAAPPRARDDEEGGADMLDWIYTLSRVALIFSVVYFYSNLTRLFLVIIFTGLVFLLQRRHVQAPAPNNNVPQPRQAHAPGAAAANARPGQAAPADPPNDANLPAAAAAAPNAEAQANSTAAPNEETPQLRQRQAQPAPAGTDAAPPAASDPVAPLPEPVPRITIWGFVSAFVTSLIPDIAQH